MRKVVKNSGNIRFEALSLVDGISMQYVFQNEEGTFVESPGCTKATILDNGDIKTELTEFDIAKKNSDDVLYTLDTISHRLAVSFRIAALVTFGLGVFVAVMGFEFAKIFWFLSMLSLSASYIAVNLAFVVLRLKKNEKVKSLIKFHSAEHAVINAYYDLKRLPEYRELRFYSNYAFDCGTTEFTMQFVASLGAAFAVLFGPSIWSLLICVISVLVTLILYKRGKLFFLQALVLEQPTSKEYKVALAVMEAELKKGEEYVKLHTAEAVNQDEIIFKKKETERPE